MNLLNVHWHHVICNNVLMFDLEGTCEEKCASVKRGHKLSGRGVDLKVSMKRLNTYKALSNPSYISQASD